MEYAMPNLKPDERAALMLRSVYEQHGYKKYKMSRFEEYSMYVENKDFLSSDKVISFTDLDGRLMALKPDVTLSIIKNTKATKESTEKLYYIENIYRECKRSHTYKEINQLGLELLGAVDIKGITEVVSLAVSSLREISSDYALDLSHMDFATELLNNLGTGEAVKEKLLKHIRNKNTDGIKKTGEKAGLDEEKLRAVCMLPSLYGPAEDTIKRASQIVLNDKMKMALGELLIIYNALKEKGNAANVKVDFSIVNEIDYYNGIIFRGYIRELGRSVLSGGQYDRAMKKFGKDIGAMGFAIYLNEISMIADDGNGEEDGEKLFSVNDDFLNIALPKGRLGDQVYDMLAKAGYDCSDFHEQNRKLVFENEAEKIRYLLVKPSDVAVYVEHHAADIGVVGKDILLETRADVYELLDLDIGKCNMAVAGPAGYVEDTGRILKVATKYTNITKEFYAEQNREIDIIQLNGSVELAPILGLSDVIVDIVETGNTLRENNLVVLEEFRQISARLIANKSSFKFQNDKINEVLKKLSDVSRMNEWGGQGN